MSTVQRKIIKKKESVFREMLKQMEDVDEEGRQIRLVPDEDVAWFDERVSDPEQQFEIISLLYRYEPSEVRKYVEDIWEAPLFVADKNNELLKQEFFLNRKIAIKGLGKCDKCGNTELQPGKQKQTRSADEGTSVELICLKCGHRQIRG